MHRIFSLFLSVCLLFSQPTVSDSMSVDAPSALLMEASSGKILFEKDAHHQLAPASVTKIMTLLLIFDALSAGKITLDDIVTVSEHAAGMGGSQVFLEAHETQTVKDLLKCIAIASANDACVAMAEYISGSETAFVKDMNERAKSLGMENTHFVNCCGLDADGHFTTAYDIGLMSRELILKYPAVNEYVTTWMDTITHNTRRGTFDFGLSNTNKLLKQYAYTTGLKTGSTDQAKFCISATAQKNGIELIAVIMAAPTPQIRQSDAITLLNYGFSICQTYTDENTDFLTPLKVIGGIDDSVPLKYQGPFFYTDISNQDLCMIHKEIQLPPDISAPVTEDDIAGKAVYYLNNQEIGNVPILFAASVEKAAFGDYFQRILQLFLL